MEGNIKTTYDNDKKPNLFEEKLVQILHYFSFKQMKKDIYDYGYSISPFKYFLGFVVGIILVTAYCIFSKLDFVYIIFEIVLLICLMPFIVRTKFKGMYQEKRFNEVDIYLHQMIFSFQKQPKILSSLEDTEKVSTGKLKNVIRKAIICLRQTEAADAYEEALDIIYMAYPNDRIKNLNKFMIQIERQGGNYGTSLDILLGDIDNWVNRTYKEQTTVKTIKTTIVIGTIISFIISSASMIFSMIIHYNDTMSIMSLGNLEDILLYQVTTAIFIAASMLFLIYAFTKYNYDWITKSVDEKSVLRNYKNATDFNPTVFRIKSIPVYLVFASVSLSMFFINAVPYNKGISVFLGIFTFYLIISPSFTKKNAYKITQKNIQNSFSEWLRDVSINLQREPLLSAVTDSYENCPVAIKPELEIFIRRIQEEPTAVEPYYEFLARFHLTDVSSAVRNLYSLSDMDDERKEENLGQLTKRNYAIINDNEIKSMNDTTSAMRFSEYIPVFIACGKLAFDIMNLLECMM